MDVLTGMVELSQNGEPLFEPFIPETPLEVVSIAAEDIEVAEDLEEEPVLL